MGATQSFDAELTAKIAEARAEFMSFVTKMPEAISESVELAEKNGLGTLKKDLENAQGGVEAVIKLFQSMDDCLDRYTEHVKRLQEALG